MSEFVETQAQVMALTMPATTAGNTFAGPQRRLWILGYSLRESTGVATADCDIKSGSDAADDTVVTLTFNQNESRVDPFPPEGVYCPAGFAVVVNAGTVRGAVWCRYE